MDVSECAFCRLPHERTRLRRDYELDICDPCAHGNAPVALRERGHTIDTRTWSITHESKDGLDTVYHLELIAHAPGDFAFTATFTREKFLDRLSKLFRKELEVGDPLFDDFVFIRTEDRAPTAALLQSSGVQSTLMALVTNFGAVNFVQGIFVLSRKSDFPLRVADDDLLPLCALLVHIERNHPH